MISMQLLKQFKYWENTDTFPIVPTEDSIKRRQKPDVVSTDLLCHDDPACVIVDGVVDHATNALQLDIDPTDGLNLNLFTNAGGNSTKYDDSVAQLIIPIHLMMCAVLLSAMHPQMMYLGLLKIYFQY